MHGCKPLTLSGYASNKLQEEARTKSTLRYLTPYHIPRTPHYCLSNAYNPYQVTRANIKSRLLLDVYPLSRVTKRMKKTTEDICPICQLDEQENQVHFLLRCPKLEEVRPKYLPKLLELLPAAVRELVINDEHLFAGLLLDASHPDVNQHVTIEHQTRIQIEAITRDYVYALHISRTALVKVAES